MQRLFTAFMHEQEQIDTEEQKVKERTIDIISLQKINSINVVQ